MKRHDVPLQLRFLICAVVFLLGPFSSLAQNPAPVITVDNPPNTRAQQAKHYVILVSLDGFRYDYPAKYGAPHLLALGAGGATAPNGMLPPFPSLTFPSHISMVTGLYPEHHGIVGNSFRDPTRPVGQDEYIYKNPRIASDGSWYKGTPLWQLAEQQGMRSASFFWPGDIAEIQGKRPSYYVPFNDKLDDHTRIDQIITWLKLPPELRPHFITLYYSNVDHAGHDFGPDSDQVRDAVHHTDDLIGELQTKLAALNLPIDIVVVADHGMVNFQSSPITLSDYSSLKNIESVGPLLYAKTDKDAEVAYKEFRKHPSDRFTVYRRKDVPPDLHFSESPREGDPVVIAHGPYRILVHGAATTDEETDNRHIGGHGFDPAIVPQMKAIFFAAGPDIRSGITLPPFENVNIYPFVARILGLVAPPSDGKLEVLAPALHGTFPPILVLAVDPQYTPAARQAKINGKVTVNFQVELDGSTSHVRVLHGLDSGLDQSAVEAVKKYRFKPATRDGIPIVVQLNAVVEFKIF